MVTERQALQKMTQKEYLSLSTVYKVTNSNGVPVRYFATEDLAKTFIEGQETDESFGIAPIFTTALNEREISALNSPQGLLHMVLEMTEEDATDFGELDGELSRLFNHLILSLNIRQNN